MLPLIKRSSDNLVAVIGEKVETGESFELFKYVCSLAALCACTCNQEYIMSLAWNANY